MKRMQKFARFDVPKLCRRSGTIGKQPSIRAELQAAILSPSPGERVKQLARADIPQIDLPSTPTGIIPFS